MTTAHYITAETISNDATADHAIRLAEILTEMGFDSVAADTCGVTPEGFASADEIPSEVWGAAIEKMLADLAE